MSANNFVAGGTINPARFVTMSTTAETVTQSGSGEKPIGICTPSQSLPPIPANSGSTAAASSGDAITVFGLGDICLLLAGSGTSVTGFVAGDFLKPDSSGRGISGTTGDYVAAVALESAAINTYGRVQLLGPVKL